MHQCSPAEKAKRIVALNVKEISSFADYMLICSGDTDRQVQAIAGAVQEYLKKEGILPLGVEGEANAQWVLLDYDDVIISVFQEEARSFMAWRISGKHRAWRLTIKRNANKS